MQQQTKKFLTTNATTCPTSRNYCVTSELLLVLFKKVKDSFIKEKKSCCIIGSDQNRLFTTEFCFLTPFQKKFGPAKKGFGSKQFWTYKLFSFGCSTCPLVFGCWELSHVIFLKLKKKELLAKLNKLTKCQPFSLKRTLLSGNCCHFVNFLNNCQAVLSFSVWEKSRD